MGLRFLYSEHIRLRGASVGGGVWPSCGVSGGVGAFGRSGMFRFKVVGIENASVRQALIVILACYS